MKQFKIITGFLLLATVTAILFLSTGCTTPSGGFGLSQSAHDLAVEGLNAAHVAGKLTNDEFIAAMQVLKASLDNDGGWTDLLMDIGKVGLSIVGSLTGVRLWRGGINSRNGSTSE